MSERMNLLDEASIKAHESDTYAALISILTWARLIERELARSSPEPSALPELQALINRAEKAEARAQELTNTLKEVEDQAREWVKNDSVSTYKYACEVCGNTILRLLGKS